MAQNACQDKYFFHNLNRMATVYILYSQSLDKYYTGSCANLEKRLFQHHNKVFPNSYTSHASDWIVFIAFNDLEYRQARNIEAHIKRMKSRTYFQNLKRYPDIIKKLKSKYEGSSR